MERNETIWETIMMGNHQRENHTACDGMVGEEESAAAAEEKAKTSLC